MRKRDIPGSGPEDEWYTTLLISDILSTLNRNDVFDDVRSSGSLARVAFTPRGSGGGFGLANFLFQMVLV